MSAEPQRAGRIGRAFSRPSTTGLVPFLTAGYPSLDATRRMMEALERAGARAVEIGIPFSDPIADGPEIQRASEWALRQGVGAGDVLELIGGHRAAGGALPIVIMTYANPILRMGAEEFAGAARAAGADGVLLTDLPPDESPEVWSAMDRASLDTIMLVAPTTAPERLPLLFDRCRGYLYCLSRTGVTGASAGYSGPIVDRIAELRARTALPIAIGFGIATADQARALVGVADGVVVGAAFMRAIAADPERGAVERVEALARELVTALGAA